jgi:rsbT antagonist protein RsbS
MPEESISVIKVKNILIVTVPRNPEDETILSLQDKILNSMQRHEIKGLILDISTVETLDSYFARTIIETAQMVDLMGGRTIIAGMRPNVAITATQLGLTFGNLLTSLDVDTALHLLKYDYGRRKSDAI